MNPFIIDILDYTLKNNFETLVLSNGMRPIELKFKKLLLLPNLKKLTVRISMDHYKEKDHEYIRGKNTWKKLIKNISWLHRHNINLNIASKLKTNETEKELRQFERSFCEVENS